MILAAEYRQVSTVGDVVSACPVVRNCCNGHFAVYPSVILSVLIFPARMLHDPSLSSLGHLWSGYALTAA